MQHEQTKLIYNGINERKKALVQRHSRLSSLRMSTCLAVARCIKETRVFTTTILDDPESRLQYKELTRNSCTQPSEMSTISPLIGESNGEGRDS